MYAKAMCGYVHQKFRNEAEVEGDAQSFLSLRLSH